MFKIKSMKLVILRLQLLGISTTVLLIYGILNSILIKSSNSKLSEKFSMDISFNSLISIGLGVALLIVYFYWSDNLRCINFKKELVAYNSDNKNEDVELKYLCDNCDIVWETVIEAGD